MGITNGPGYNDMYSQGYVAIGPTVMRKGVRRATQGSFYSPRMRSRALGQGACLPGSLLLMSTFVTLVKSFSLFFLKIYFILNYVYACVSVWL